MTTSTPFDDLTAEELAGHASMLAVGDSIEDPGPSVEGGSAAITFAVLALCCYVAELTAVVERIASAEEQ